jgi:hypothetical protein
VGSNFKRVIKQVEKVPFYFFSDLWFAKIQRYNNFVQTPVDDGQGDAGEERGRRQVVLGLDDPQPGFGARDHEVESADADDPVQRRAETRLDDPESEADDDDEKPEKRNK